MSDTEHEDEYFWDRNSEQFRYSLFIACLVAISIVSVLIILHFIRKTVVGQTRQRAFNDQLHLIIIDNNYTERAKPGLAASLITSLPIFEFKGNTTHQYCNVTEECTICLSKYETGEALRFLPICKHNFHAQCIDKWLRENSVCPICRTDTKPLLIPEPREAVADERPRATPERSPFTTAGPYTFFPF